MSRVAFQNVGAGRSAFELTHHVNTLTAVEYRVLWLTVIYYFSEIEAKEAVANF